MRSRKWFRNWVPILRGGILSPQRRDWSDHLGVSLKWLRLATAVVGNKGLSKGYDLIRRRWHPLYPEITGYTIPTLLNISLLTKDPSWESLALDCATHLLNYRTRDGGIYTWQKEQNEFPVIFDTGQAIFGWISAYLHTGNSLFLEAAIHSGNWLVQQQAMNGVWVRHQHLGYPKVIDARVDWALLELNKITGKKEYFDAAFRNLHWVLENQQSNGWFAHCGFRATESPFTHTLAYTAESLFFCGKITNDERFLLAAKKTADALLKQQRPNGWLAGAFGKQWEITENSVCLTGNAQMSKLWMYMAKEFHAPEYEMAAIKSLEFVCRTQHLEKNPPQIQGGIAGSFPIYGKYERFKYPGWACKFFIDALLAVQENHSAQRYITYPG